MNLIKIIKKNHSPTRFDTYDMYSEIIFLIVNLLNEGQRTISKTAVSWIARHVTVSNVSTYAESNSCMQNTKGNVNVKWRLSIARKPDKLYREKIKNIQILSFVNES